MVLFTFGNAKNKHGFVDMVVVLYASFVSFVSRRNETTTVACRFSYVDAWDCVEM